MGVFRTFKSAHATFVMLICLFNHECILFVNCLFLLPLHTLITGTALFGPFVDLSVLP